MNILVIGGAGFIGSHMVKLLGKCGANITILDNLSTGHLDSVLYGNFIYGDFGDKTVLKKVFSNKFDAVMHFASSIIVNESIINPHKYYENNLINTVNLLGVMKNSDVKNFIFSSTAAIFGNPIYIPIDEKHLQNPINSYGRSKFLVENILVDYQNAYNLKSICLRYFNAAGADPDGELGERHDPETHLIPLILRVASGKSDSIKVFGQDYDTPDGTCIRDFIHVQDICSAHLLSLEALLNGSNSNCYNLGNGIGFSVKEIIKVIEKITGCNINIVNMPRRNGDPPYLISDSKLANDNLGWFPKYSDIETIITHAWNWELINSNNKF